MDGLPTDTAVDVEQINDTQNSSVVITNGSGNGDVNTSNIPSPTPSQSNSQRSPIEDNNRHRRRHHRHHRHHRRHRHNRRSGFKFRIIL